VNIANYEFAYDKALRRTVILSNKRHGLAKLALSFLVALLVASQLIALASAAAKTFSFVTVESSPRVTLTYPYLQRYGRASDVLVSFKLSKQQTASLIIPRDFSKSFQIYKISPAPVKSKSQLQGTTFTFAAQNDGDFQLKLSLVPRTLGSNSATVVAQAGDDYSATMNIKQIIFP
jgi:hypothetical protein